METLLQEENQRLRQQLNTYIAEARSNEEKLRRFHAFELTLIGSASLQELLTRVLEVMPSIFNLDVVTLLLLDPEYECHRLLNTSTAKGWTHAGLLLAPAPHALETVFQGATSCHLTTYAEEVHRQLFPTELITPHCVAILPLFNQGKLLGSLNLGSLDKNRYADNSGTEFLERLATITAISLINSLNHERLKRVGLTDPLTQLNNRRFFDQRLREEVATAQRSGQPLACMFIDADHFKRINDTHGHQVGDAVLMQLSQLVKEQLRLGDILARYGGEEFVALLPNTGRDEAARIAERIRGLVAAQPITTGEQSLAITISLGIASLEGGEMKGIGEAARALLSRADSALYLAKEGGRNRVEQT